MGREEIFLKDGDRSRGDGREEKRVTYSNGLGRAFTERLIVFCISEHSIAWNGKRDIF
jgi:hypothetical protein